MQLASTITVITRGDPSPTQAPASPHANTSFFTFLIALLILVFASGALVLRAVLIRRRYRRRVQEAINAGILPNAPTIQHKPELYEVCVRAAGDTMDWRTLMPICATNLERSQHIQVDSKRKPITVNHSVVGRLRELFGRHPTRTPSANDAKDVQPSTLQVAVLIAMPSEHPNIPSADSASLPALPESERRDSTMKVNDDAMPDLIFGVSTFAMISDKAD